MRRSLSHAALASRAKYEESKHRRGPGGKFADKPGEAESGVGASEGRRKISDVGRDDVVRVRVDKNPKKPGSAAHAAFARYRDGMTVGEFTDLFPTRREALSHLKWDSERGFVEFEAVGATDAVKAAKAAGASAPLATERPIRRMEAVDHEDLELTPYEPSEKDAQIVVSSVDVPREGPLVIHHVTSAQSARSILSSGFKAGTANQIQGFESHVRGTYGWASEARARLEIGRLAEAGIDPNDFVSVRVAIPRSAWSRLRPDEDHSLDDDWRGSLRDLMSVVHEGDVPREWITGLSGSAHALSKAGIRTRVTDQPAPAVPRAAVAGDSSSVDVPSVRSPRDAALVAKMTPNERGALADIARRGGYNESVSDISGRYGLSTAQARSVSRVAYGNFRPR